MAERVAIVTGGTGALGRKVVEKFSDEGIKVYVPSLSLEEFNSIFDSSQNKNADDYKLKKIFSFECDATDENSVREFVNNVSVQEKGKIDCLINTIGGYTQESSVIDLSSETLDKMMTLNFKTTFYFTKEVLKVMKKNSYGRIISIGGVTKAENSVEKFAYSFSKTGVTYLMDSISEEMKGLNIRCNTIVPGIIDTEANRQWGSKEDVKKWVKPEDIAEIIYNLISVEFSSIRSSHIKVYGAL